MRCMHSLNYKPPVAFRYLQLEKIISAPVGGPRWITYSWAPRWAYSHPWWALWWICLSAPARFHGIWFALWSPDCPGKSHWTPKWGVPFLPERQSCLLDSVELGMNVLAFHHVVAMRRGEFRVSSESFPAPLSSSLPPKILAAFFPRLPLIKTVVVWLLLVRVG